MTKEPWSLCFSYARSQGTRIMSVTLCNAWNLSLEDGEGAYAIFGFPGRRKQTEIVLGDPNPHWDKCLRFLDENLMTGKGLEVILFKQKGKQAKFLGKVKIPETPFAPARSETTPKYFESEDMKIEVGLKLCYEDFVPNFLPEPIVYGTLHYKKNVR